VVDAVRCAVEIQHALEVKNEELPDNRQMQFRIGINLGDVIVEGERLYGDGVNIAARLESLALPGGICISGTVHDHVKNKLALTYEDLGEQVVKNIAEPVRVYRVGMDEATSQKATGKAQKAKVERRAGIARRKWLTLTVTGLLLIAATIGVVRYWLSSIPNTQPSTPSTQAAPAALPLPDKPSLVVLPFVNMSNDPEQEYFSDGITEDITSDLSQISGLFVIARNSAFTYKGKAVKVQDVSREMGVRYVLEGSVRRADNQVRVTTQLIDATTGYHLWSERYDRPLKDIFALQDEIVRKIVTTLNLQIRLREQGAALEVRKRTANLEAYDSVLRGMAYTYRFTKEANVQARQMYEKAIELDPEYVSAYVGLGFTYYIDWIWQWSQDPQTPERALELAQKALALDDFSPWPHNLLGAIYLYIKKQYDQAFAEVERTIALDPNSAEGYWRMGEILGSMGKPEEGIGWIKKAMRLNPRYPGYYAQTLGGAYFLAGRYEEAITALQDALPRNPDYMWTHVSLALSYWQQWAQQQSQDPQTLERALTAAQRAVALSEATAGTHQALSVVYLWKKQYAQALTEGERAMALDPNETIDIYPGLAQSLSYAGQPEEAIRLIETAMRLSPRYLVFYPHELGLAYLLAGRYEEALAALQDALRRNPNYLPVHRDLAVVYSELGKETEARAEVAEVLRINPKFSLEVHRARVPIKDPTVLEQHIAALRKAGLK
jgi:adenylate cyclase